MVGLSSQPWRGYSRPRLLHRADRDLPTVVLFLRHRAGAGGSYFNVTRHPSADWVVQHLRETFLEADPYRYAILDHDSIFNADVIAFLKATGLKPKRTSIQSP